VEGRLQTRSWDTPEGERKYRTEVIADRVLFLDRAGEMPFSEQRDAVPAGGGDMEPEDIPFE
jgi:single-strand DNA-binding protein